MKDINKQIKKMSRNELLEIMLLQSKKIDELECEIKKTKELLEDKKIILSNCGSIAEAALKLNNIFEDAQKAADQYLKNIELISNTKLSSKENVHKNKDSSNKS